MPQTEITVNLLRQSNATPTVLAYAHLSGPFDYNKMPLAPMGCAVQIHEKINEVRGHITSLMYGILHHLQSIIERIHVMSKQLAAKDSPTQRSSNTKISRILPIHMPTK